MLEEAQHLKRQGNDIVVGYFEPHGRKDTIAKTVGLEMIPTRTITYRASTFQEMDTDAILKRRPAICVVDELAHTNVPGSQRAKRWEDVQVLLDAGIDVMTNMNIQHLESLNDQIFRITGVRVRETVPDWFVKSATEVVMVDATTGALLNRLKERRYLRPGKSAAGDGEFLQGIDSHGTTGTRHAPGRARTRIAGNRQHIRGTSTTARDLPAASPSSPRATMDRILIYVSADSSTAMLIRRGTKNG